MEEEPAGPVGPFEDLKVIRIEAGIATSGFRQLVDMPERTWRWWQVRTKAERPPKAPRPQPLWGAVRKAVINQTSEHPTWGLRKVWAMTRHDGPRVSESRVLRLLRDEATIRSGTSSESAAASLSGLRRARRSRVIEAKRGRWTSVGSGSRPVGRGGAWRACTNGLDMGSRLSCTQGGSMHDAVAAVELVFAEGETLFGHTLMDDAPAKPSDR